MANLHALVTVQLAAKPKKPICFKLPECQCFSIPPQLRECSTPPSTACLTYPSYKFQEIFIFSRLWSSCPPTTSLPLLNLSISNQWTHLWFLLNIVVRRKTPPHTCFPRSSRTLLFPPHLALLMFPPTPPRRTESQYSLIFESSHTCCLLL